MTTLRNPEALPSLNWEVNQLRPITEREFEENTNCKEWHLWDPETETWVTRGTGTGPGVVPGKMWKKMARTQTICVPCTPEPVALPDAVEPRNPEQWQPDLLAQYGMRPLTWGEFRGRMHVDQWHTLKANGVWSKLVGTEDLDAWCILAANRTVAVPVGLPPQQPQYKIISSDTLDGLSELVTQHLRDGWAMQGGVAFDPHPVSGTTVCQAITR